MSDTWAVDLAREEVCISSDDLSSTNSTPRSEGERTEQQPTIIDDGYGTSSSLEVDCERFGGHFQPVKGRKKKTEISRNEIKRHIKNGNQRYRKRQERYYIDALKKIYIENGYVTTTTPKRSVTDFETLRITRKKMEEFIAAGVPNEKIRHYVKTITNKEKY